MLIITYTFFCMNFTGSFVDWLNELQDYFSIQNVAYVFFHRESHRAMPIKTMESAVNIQPYYGHATIGAVEMKEVKRRSRRLCAWTA
jgi:hypothetical protein